MKNTTQTDTRVARETTPLTESDVGAQATADALTASGCPRITDAEAEKTRALQVTRENGVNPLGFTDFCNALDAAASHGGQNTSGTYSDPESEQGGEAQQPAWLGASADSTGGDSDRGWVMVGPPADNAPSQQRTTSLLNVSTLCCGVTALRQQIVSTVRRAATPTPTPRAADPVRPKCD